MRSPVQSSEKKESARKNAKKVKNIMSLIKDANGPLRDSARVLSRKNSKDQNNIISNALMSTNYEKNKIDTHKHHKSPICKT